MTDISTWSTTAANNNSASPDGFPEGMAAAGVNNSAREVMAAVRRQHVQAEWIDLGDTPTQASATTFTISGDVTATYQVGRRIRCTDSSTLYGLITASSYSAPNTTVTVSLDSGSLSGSLSAVALGILSVTNKSLNILDEDAMGSNSAVALATQQSIKAYVDASNKFVTGTTTFDLSSANGTNITVTGLGFQPQGLICIATVNGAAYASWGITDGTTDLNMRSNSGGTADNFTTTGNLLLIELSSGNNQTFDLSSFDSGGFTIANTKTGTTAGTMTLLYMAFGTA